MNMMELSVEEMVVVVAEDATIVETFAAAEFQRHLRKATGADLPIIHRDDEEKQRVVIGDMARKHLNDDDTGRLTHDGFIVRGERERALIVGANPRGTLNGVYHLLRECGFRWMFPGENEEIIPTLSALPVQLGSRIVNPDLEIRGVCVIPVDKEFVDQARNIIDWMGKNAFNLLLTSPDRANMRKNGWQNKWENVTDELLVEIEKRGIILNMGEHSGRYFFPLSYFDDHPEWFALNQDGERWRKQICYSNEEAVAVLADNYVRYLEKHPEVDIIGTWPEDGYGFCQCEKCRQPGVILKAINAVAERIERARPDVTVEYLSYTEETSVVPPNVNPHRNIVVLVANTRVAEGWMAKSNVADARGVYRLHYHIADNTAERASLPLRFGETRRDCREARRLGLRGIIPFYIGIDTWWRSSLNLHFLSRFSWNVDADPDDILADFCRTHYPNVDGMFELFKRLETMPMVAQHAQPPWPLWQDWPDIKRTYAGEQWEETVQTFETLHGDLNRLRETANSSIPTRRFDAIEAFLDSSLTMFRAWHERALAVMAFEQNDSVKTREHIVKTAEYENRLTNMHKSGDGVNGAWPDFAFFQNWRLQLDKQLMEMRTKDQKVPITDENPDFEMFLPALLGL